MPHALISPCLPLLTAPPPVCVIQLLMDMRLVSTARRTFDRALAALPITQHDRIWVLYLVSQGVSESRSVENECMSMRECEK